MNDKIPKIYKNKVDKIKSKIQKNFYYHSKNEENKVVSEDIKVPDRKTLIEKISSIFKRPDYVYKADVNIMYKNGENKHKKIVGIKDNYLLTLDDEKIMISDILDIK